MNIKDLIKKELEEQRKRRGLSIKDPRSAKPPKEKEMEDEEDTDISSPEFKEFGKLPKKDAEKGWGDGPVKETIRQEIMRTLEEHGELDEGFLDRLKANVAGAVGSAGAKVSQARSKVGAAVAGPGSSVTYTGDDPQRKRDAVKLKTRTATMLRKFQKLAADFNNDAARLGLDTDALVAVNGSMDALTAALETALISARQSARGKDLSAAQTLQVTRRRINDPTLAKMFKQLMRQSQELEAGAQVKDRGTEKQVSGPMQGSSAGAPIQPRQTAKQTSGPGPESTRDRIKRAARKSGDALSRSTRQKGRQISEQLIQKIVDMLVENFK
jgi:hypothetical protein